MLHRTVALLLICTLNFQIFSQIGIFGYFVLNNDYVAKVLCQNKNRPELHCNGQCYLAKQLKAAEQKDRQNMADLLKVNEIQLFCSETFIINFKNFPTFLFQKHAIFYLLTNYTTPQFSVFQPPRN
jgi:hypothetical protein